jgi:membrane fusion protein, heavy metal efflux system
MLFGSSRPASRRKFTAFHGFRRGCWLLLAWLSLAVLWETPTSAHEGHEHAPPATTVVGPPRLVAKSEAYELVAILERERLTIYLDRFEDNAPVTDAKINVSINGETVAAEATPEGSYVLASHLLSGRGYAELVFDIMAPEGDDLLIGSLRLVNGGAAEALAVSRYEQVWAAVRHGAQDHLALLSLALVLGAVLGIGLRGRPRVRVSSILILTMASLTMSASERAARAHEGHDENAKAPIAQADTARRLPGGQVFVPKPMQRILDVRTVAAKPQTVPKTAVFVGRIIADPNRSGVVQSINGGRAIAPEQGLPRLGQRIAKGDILVSVEPALPLADRTTISERAGEIEQLIAVAEAKLRRLRPLGERGVIAAAQIIDAETELEGLYRRRNVIRETRVEPEVLRAPIDGVIAIARVVSGQVVQAQDVLFQVIDPASLWVEAFDYGDTDPTILKHATAIGAGNKPMTLSFQGWSRALQQQATVVQFSIADPPPSIRVGQPVTVTAEQSDTVTGVIVSRNAIVRGGNGETIVWRHVEPELFEQRTVRTEPFDAANVLIAAGVTDGDRIVVRGAELINQIR